MKKPLINKKLRNSTTSIPTEDKEYPMISEDVFAVFEEQKRISVVYYDFEKRMWFDTLEDEIINEPFQWFDVEFR